MKTIPRTDIPPLEHRRVNGTDRFAFEVYDEFHIGNMPFDCIVVDAQHHDDDTWSDYRFYGENEDNEHFELIDGIDLDADLREVLVEEHKNLFSILNEADDGHEDDGDEDDDV